MKVRTGETFSTSTTSCAALQNPKSIDNRTRRAAVVLQKIDNLSDSHLSGGEIRAPALYALERRRIGDQDAPAFVGGRPVLDATEL
jgi:hypothetical protein